MWKWYSRAHLSEFTAHPRNLANANPSREFVHANTLLYDVHHQAVYLNSRHMDTFFKIDRRTGAILYGVGRCATPPPSFFPRWLHLKPQNLVGYDVQKKWKPLVFISLGTLPV